jgi:hypothetical protein
MPIKSKLKRSSNAVCTTIQGKLPLNLGKDVPHHVVVPTNRVLSRLKTVLSKQTLSPLPIKEYLKRDTLTIVTNGMSKTKILRVLNRTNLRNASWKLDSPSVFKAATLDITILQSLTPKVIFLQN